MSNDKTYDRHVNIWINGKEVKNDISSIKKEMYQLTNQQAKMTIGSKEYIEKGKEIGKLKGILDAHRKSVAATGSVWSNLNGVVGGSLSKLTSAFKALMANPVVLIITAIGAALSALLKAFKSSDSGATEFAARFEQVKAVLDVVRQRLIGVTQAIGHVFKGEWKEAAASMKEAFTDIGEQIRSATGAAYDYQYALDRTQDTENNYISKAAENRNKIAKLEYMAQDRTKSTEERRKALKEALEIGMEEVTAAQSFARQKLDNEINYLAGKAGLRSKDVLAYIQMTDAEQENASESLKTLRNNNEDKFTEIEKLYAAWIDIDTRFFEENKRNIGRMTGFEEEQRQNKLKAEQELADKLIELKKQNAEVHKIQFKQNGEDELNTLKEYSGYTLDEINARTKAQLAAETEAAAELSGIKKEMVQGTTELAMTLYDRQFAKLDAQYKKDIAAAGDNAALKAKIDEDYNKKKSALSRKAAVAEKLSALFSIGLDTAKGVVNAASKIVTIPLIPWIIANGAIQAAITAAKPVPQFDVGGFTKNGSKYEPAGVVHAGEWVANQELVSSPQTGPIIQALEQYRVNGLFGYANGGGPGMSSSGSGAAGSSSALIGTNPKLERTLDDIRILLAYLRNEGVTTRFDYLSVDNIRKGMDKLEDIEEDVTI
jgi:hypothetical protein